MLAKRLSIFWVRYAEFDYQTAVTPTPSPQPGDVAANERRRRAHVGEVVARRVLAPAVAGRPAAGRAREQRRELAGLLAAAGRAPRVEARLGSFLEHLRLGEV